MSPYYQVIAIKLSLIKRHFFSYSDKLNATFLIFVNLITSTLIPHQQSNVRALKEIQWGPCVTIVSCPLHKDYSGTYLNQDKGTAVYHSQQKFAVI